jgi:hypothetical protein
MPMNILPDGVSWWKVLAIIGGAFACGLVAMFLVLRWSIKQLFKDLW